MQDSPIKLLAHKLLECEDGKIPPELLDRLNSIAKQANREIKNAAGEFLHNLNDCKHTKEQVKCVVKLFPSALSYKKDGRLPVQKAVCYKESLSFISRLAKESDALDVGGNDSSGGLLNPLPIDPGNVNAFQILSQGTFCAMSSGDSDKPGVGHDNVDLKYLQVLDELRTLNLLKKEHVIRYDLLGWASYPTSRRRFEFFVEWCPAALQVSKHKGVPLVHDTILRPIHTKPRQCFEMVLAAGMKFFPEKYGFLFQKHNGKPACEYALEKFGTDDTMTSLRKFILPSAKYPILHRVAIHAPQYMNDFARYYPNAIYLRDENDRLLFHTELATGTKNFVTDSLFFLTAMDNQIQEKDPVTGLFPFMLAASGNISDLSAVYSLLVRHPGLVEVRLEGMKRSPKAKRIARKRTRRRSQQGAFAIRNKTASSTANSCLDDTHSKKDISGVKVIERTDKNPHLEIKSSTRVQHREGIKNETTSTTLHSCGMPNPKKNIDTEGAEMILTSDKNMPLEVKDKTQILEPIYNKDVPRVDADMKTSTLKRRLDSPIEGVKPILKVDKDAKYATLRTQEGTVNEEIDTSTKKNALPDTEYRGCDRGIYGISKSPKKTTSSNLEKLLQADRKRETRDASETKEESTHSSDTTMVISNTPERKIKDDSNHSSDTTVVMSNTPEREMKDESNHSSDTTVVMSNTPERKIKDESTYSSDTTIVMSYTPERSKMAKKEVISKSKPPISPPKLVRKHDHNPPISPNGVDHHLITNVSVRNRSQIFEKKKKRNVAVRNGRARMERVESKEESLSPVSARIRGIEESLSKHGTKNGTRDLRPSTFTRV